MTYQRKEVIGDCTLYLGDCLEVMPTLGEFDAVVTDPPYGVGLNTDSSRFSGGAPESRSGRGRGKGAAGGRSILNDSEPFDPSPLFGVAAHHIIWGWNNYADKLTRGTALVWIKRNDAAFGSFLSDAEIAWFSKGHGVYCNRDLSNQGITNERQHPTQKPVSLMEWCLEFLPAAETALDPFMGSGTTGVACVNLGRAFTGIELDETYFDIACQRIDEAYKQPRLFEEPAPKPVQETISFDEDEGFGGVITSEGFGGV